MKLKRKRINLPARQMKQVTKEISSGNLQDLISPFLYQIGVLKHSEEATNFVIQYKSGRHYLTFDVKGVEKVIEKLQEGDTI